MRQEPFAFQQFGRIRVDVDVETKQDLGVGAPFEQAVDRIGKGGRCLVMNSNLKNRANSSGTLFSLTTETSMFPQSFRNPLFVESIPNFQ